MFMIYGSTLLLLGDPAGHVKVSIYSTLPIYFITLYYITLGVMPRAKDQPFEIN